MLILGMATMAVTPPAQAQENSSEPCELHVWPAATMRFSDQGMWDNFGSGVKGGVLGEMTTAESRLNRSDREGTDHLPDDPAKLMGQAEQEALLATIADGAAFGLPRYKLIVHREALESRVIRNNTGRYAPESAPCYADLVLESLIFSNEWGNGQNLKSLYRFRDFGTGDMAARSFGAWVKTKMAIEPEDLPAKFDQARAEMRAAFMNNVTLFGAALTKNATAVSIKQGMKK